MCYNPFSDHSVICCIRYKHLRDPTGISYICCNHSGDQSVISCVVITFQAMLTFGVNKHAPPGTNMPHNKIAYIPGDHVALPIFRSMLKSQIFKTVFSFLW